MIKKYNMVMMFCVDDAFNHILSLAQKTDSMHVEINNSLSHVLLENVVADRDLPPFDRVTMDGIAIRYEDYDSGLRDYKIVGTQGAGEGALSVRSEECIKIMTGASLGKTLDTVIPVEQIKIKNDIATIDTQKLEQAQFVHFRGSDARKGEVLVEPGTRITPDVLAIMASVGMTKVKVAKLPKVCVISTGDELVDPDKPVGDVQIRRSNDLVIQGILKKFNVKTESFHIKDNGSKIRRTIETSLKEFDIVIISGGVSRGDYDFVQTALTKLGVKKHFHGIKQKPGKPFWFGTLDEKPVFALPGNPVSVHLCMTRYIVPYLSKSFGLGRPEMYAILDEDIPANSKLTNFILVKTYFDKNACLHAMPIKNNNSGDFRSMIEADAFLELPEGQKKHKKNKKYRTWNYKSWIMY